jgi:microcompartment protein CcmL/EutN
LGNSGNRETFFAYQTKARYKNMDKAIALLEVQAMVTAIVGLDAMIKAADVKLIHVEKRLGGRLVTVVVEGSVSAVQAAADAGKAAAAEVGNVKLCEVIARPHTEAMKFLRTDAIP